MNNRVVNFATVLASVFLLPLPLAFGQADNQAKDIYAGAKDSVFLLYINDSGGVPNALGSAFIAAPHVLVTNAHVIKSGSPVLAAGPLRVPLKVLRVDYEHDLALLSVGIDLVSKPLLLSSTKVAPGEQVFAIGNPEGLENTISQGIVSGLRTTGSKDLIQITTAISHGSSGGPVLNGKGEVIGVAVGMLEDGQNLNFAVPVRYVRELLEAKTDVKSRVMDCSSATIQKLRENLTNSTYSDEESSPYQTNLRALTETAKTASDSCTDPAVLERLACLGTEYRDLSDIGIDAAHKLVSAKPSPEYRALLTYALYDRNDYENTRSLFEQDSQKKASFETAARSFRDQSVKVAAEVPADTHTHASLVAKYVLGMNKLDNKEFNAATILLTPVINAAPLMACEDDVSRLAYQSIISNSPTPATASSWFQRYSSKYDPAPYEWGPEADRRNEAKDYEAAAHAYEKAALGGEYYAHYYCSAAIMRAIQDKDDEVLEDGRKCVQGSVTGNSSLKETYEKKLPYVYQGMASVLETRGVYPQALEYVKSSLAIEPNNSWALIIEAKIYEDTQRTTECIAAAQAAIRVSDGKFPEMHFRLGNCYFESENWSMAEQSFRIAANADKKDAASAYDLGLSLYRQGYRTDAKQWFEEALRRNPEPSLRNKIIDMLR